MSSPRIAVLDIETAPLIAQVWGLFDQNIGLGQIERDWSILSFGWKWLDDNRFTYRDQSQADDIEDDSLLLEAVWNLLDEADIVIAHNGRKFDFKKLNARFILAGMSPPAPYRVIDTLLEVRRVAAFTSNKLAYLTDKLTETKKGSHVRYPGHALWKACLKGDPQAWREMKKYNKLDVLSLEELYLKLRPWMVSHPNVIAYDLADGVTEMACTRCGSAEMQSRGFRVTQAGRYRRYQCQECGGWSTGRLMEKDNREGLLTN